MNERNAIGSALRLLPWLLLLGSLGCEDQGTGKRRGGRGGPGEEVSIAVEAVRKEPVRETLLAHSALEPEALVEISSRQDGLVIEILAEAGDRVRAGQVLARLEDKREQLKHRESELALKRAGTSLRRVRSLREKGLASEEEVEQAAEIVKQAELAVEAALLDLGEMQVRSSIGGVVSERSVHKGSRLRGGEVAFRVADRDPLLAKVRIPEAQAEHLAVKQLAILRVDELKEPLRGKVLRVAPVVDLGSGTVEATIAVSAGIERVRLNRFASVEIVVAERSAALTISQSALALRGEEDRIWVWQPTGSGADGRGAVRRRRIRVGVRDGERVEVLEGLAEGDWVVVAAPDDLRDGAKVRVVPSKQKASVPSSTAPQAGGEDAPPRGPKAKGQ